MALSRKSASPWRRKASTVVAVISLVSCTLMASTAARIIPLAEAVPKCNGDCTKLENTTLSQDDSFTVSEGGDSPLDSGSEEEKEETQEEILPTKKDMKPQMKKIDGGDGQECSNGCWVMDRPGPDRNCLCMNSTATSGACFGTEIQSAEECTICDRGYGVYDTHEECMAPGGEDIQAVEGGIDPQYYLSPKPASTWCPGKRQMKTTHGECPHSQQGLSYWHDPKTWGGYVPSPGTWATLPQWKKVLVTSCSVKSWETYAGIVIPENSELIFADEEIHMSVGVIYVHGRLRIGSRQCRILSDVTITFKYLENKGINFFDMGIVVSRSGQLDLHAKRYYPTWTRLGKTGHAGSNYLTLKKKVDWQPGQLVVVTTTIWKDEWYNQNEVLMIKGVTGDKYTIFFDKLLQYTHYGGSEYQAEVGLLSRNILLQGVKETQYLQKGPGIRIQGQGRMSGIMTYRMGQKNVNGAYPVHFHLMGYAPHSYITDSTVYKSYYRGVALHGTNNLLIKENVAFDVIGNCYYMEDGVEEYNWLEKNLAAFVHVIGKAAAGTFQEGETFAQSARLANPADSTASGFYITNAHNTIKDNAASGGFAGFSFPKLNEPLQNHSGMKHIKPHERPLILFDGNTAHSSGYHWFRGACIYFGGYLWKDQHNGDKLYYNSGRHERNTRDNNGNKAFNVLTNTKVFLCNRGINHWGARAEVKNYEAYEVTRGITLFGESTLQNARISLTSGNKWSWFPGSYYDLLPIAGFQWYDDSARTIISDTIFEGYKWKTGSQKQSVFLSMTHSDEFKPSGISATRNITYINVDERAILRNEAKGTGSSRYFNWIDHDGSSVKASKPMLIGSWPSWWNLGDECQWKSTWNAWLCEKMPGKEIARLDIRVPWYTKPVKKGSSVPPIKANEIGYVSHFAVPNQQLRKMVVTKNEGITGVTGDTGWYLHFTHGAPAEMEIFMTQIPKDTSIMFATRFPPGTRISIQNVFKWHARKNFYLRYVHSIAQVHEGNGDVYHFDGKHLFVKLMDNGAAKRPAGFTRNGITVHGNRWYDASYKIRTDLNCPWRGQGPLCHVEVNYPPAALPDRIKIDHCTDYGPKSHPRCSTIKKDGKCSKQWIKSGKYCQITCGACTIQSTQQAFGKPQQAQQQAPPPQQRKSCDDVSPPGGFSCAQQKHWGKCSQDWIVKKGFCRKTCNRCGIYASEDDESPFENTLLDDLTVFEDVSEVEDIFIKGGKLEVVEDVGFGEALAPDSSDGDVKITTASIPVEEKSEEVEYCRDVAPPGRLTCVQHSAWGVCNEPWMVKNGWCNLACGRCSYLTECVDIPMPDGTSCKRHVENGNCHHPFLVAGGYCEESCRRCAVQMLEDALESVGIETVPIFEQQICEDVAPPGTLSCVQLSRQGRCSDTAVKDKGLCSVTCGHCN